MIFNKKNALIKNSTYISIVFFASILFQGCKSVESALDIKNNVTSQVNEITANIMQIQENLTAKKRELDQKLKELEEAQAALSKLFGENTPEKEQQKEKIAEIEKTIDTLTTETHTIQQEVLTGSQNIEILEETKQAEQESASSGVFSIE